MKQKGYTLITHFVHGNVLGYVIAPKGKENLPKEERIGVWRVIFCPLSSEVAEHEDFPRDDAMKVVQKLGKFCEAEGLCVPVD